MAAFKSFTELDCWKKGRDLRLNLKKVLQKLPAEENYRLKDQIIRAGRSVTNNIAEGFGRYHYQENIQFCRQARGSLTEILDHLIICFDEKFITKEDLEAYKKEIDVCILILNSYIKYLQKAKSDNKITI